MNTWNKIVAAWKFTFEGFEPTTDYLLRLLNKCLAREDAYERIERTKVQIATILRYLRKYQDFCPALWSAQYEKLLSAIEKLSDALADNKITADELGKANAKAVNSVDEWFKD